MKKGIKRIISGILAASMLIAGAAAFSVAAQDELEVDDLKVCSLSEPLGIDEIPLFSWSAQSPVRGDSQSAYRIIVSKEKEDIENGKGTVWDSGKVESPDMLSVRYDGEELESRTTYYWNVTVFAKSGLSASGKGSVFSTGILDEKEWTGDWIGASGQPETDINLTGAKWIWKRGGAAFSASKAGKQYYRFDFTPAAGKTVESFEIAYTIDDKGELYLNGTKVSEISLWSDGRFYAGTELIKQGVNTIAICAENATVGYAGVVAKLRISYTDGSADTYVSDSSWKLSEKEVSGWTETDFDDSSWQSPDQAESFGVSPWGTGVALRADASRAAVVLREEFTVDKSVKEAFVYICGLGFFDLHINGKAPDDSVLNPFTTQYNETVYYLTYDVTSLLRSGNNAIGVELGNSFYNEIGGVWNWPTASWRDNPKLLLRLDIRYTDGTEKTVVSNTDWKVTTDGPITANSMYYGDVYDARKELPGYDQVGFDDSAWKNAEVMEAPEGELKPQMKAPVKRVASFEPVEIIKLDDGSYRVESPELCSGWILLRGINGDAGDKITITYGQHLNDDGSLRKYGYTDGTLASWYPHAYFQQDVYYCSGKGDEEYEPKFSYKGFEYIQIDGYEGELTKDDVVIYRVTNSADIISEFETSNELLNTLHKSMLNAMADNFHGEHCDPMLEKTGWLGDQNVSFTSLAFNFDMASVFDGMMEVMVDCQEHYGYIPQMVPTADWGLSNYIVWNSVFVFGMEDLENYFGTTGYTEKYYDALRQYTVRIITEIRGNRWVWFDNQLADWVAPIGGSNPDVQYNENVSEGSGIVGTAFAYGLIGIMQEYAERYGKTEDAEMFASARENIYKAFNDKFYDAEQGIYRTTTWTQIGTRTKYRQTSNLVPLAFGLVPDEYVDTVVENLVADIIEKDYHLDTGCVGTRYILPVLCDYGQSEIAYRIATQTTYPSWGFWVEQGAKSTWEMWETTTRSCDHYFLGTYDEWYFSHLAGIRDVDNGYATFTIRPEFIGDLDWVKASVDTERGTVSSQWTRNENDIELKVSVPFGAQATVVLPTSELSKIKLDGGTDISGTDGVIAVAESSDGLVSITVGSGDYVFAVTGSEKISVYKAALESALKQAQELIASGDASSMEAVLSALCENAQKLIDDESATQVAVNEAYNALAEAIKAAQGSEEKQQLSALISLCTRINKRIVYREDAWQTYRSVLTSAQRTVADTTSTDEDFKAAYDALSAASDALSEGKQTNLVLGIRPTASSTNESAEWNWGLALATDGDIANSGPQAGEYTGYCSSASTNASDHVEWLMIDLGSSKTVDHVVIYPGSSQTENGRYCYGMPVDFKIEVSQDAKQWTAVYEATDYPLPEYSAQVFAFEETEARYVRLYADSLRPKETDGNRYFLQITEFEVYDLPEYTEADKSALEETLATMLGVIGGSIYSGASDDAKNSFGIALALAQGVFDDEYALDSEVEKALGDLTDAYEALEKSSEEGQTPGTEAPDEDVTTAPDTEKSPSDDPDKGGKDSGALPFIIGGVVIVVVAAAGVTVFLVLRKKKK